MNLQKKKRIFKLEYAKEEEIQIFKKASFK